MTFEPFEAKIGYAFDVGVFTIPTEVGDLAGTNAILNIGTKTDGQNIRRLELDSSSPPAAPAAFVYDQQARTLKVDLTQAQISQIGPGDWTLEVGILRSGQPLFGGEGFFIVRKSV